MLTFKYLETHTDIVLGGGGVRLRGGWKPELGFHNQINKALSSLEERARCPDVEASRAVSLCFLAVTPSPSCSTVLQTTGRETEASVSVCALLAASTAACTGLFLCELPAEGRSLAR